MEMATEIPICEIRMVVTRLLDHIERDLGRPIVSLSADDYWDVADDQRYEFDKSPEGYVVGKLSDDWEFLAAVLEDQDQAASLMLVHLAPLLRRIGEQIGH